MSAEKTPDEISLKQRLERERAFHDEKYTTYEDVPKHYAVNPTAAIYQRMLEHLGRVKDLDILEYGCGDGWVTRDLAKSGGRVQAFDISGTAIENTRVLLEKAGVSDQCRLFVSAAEKLDVPDASIDRAVGFAILHHLNLDHALPEMHRVLRPGGKAVFAEPLDSNPAIQLYRRMTPKFRTPDEEPFKLRKVLPKFRDFEKVEHFEIALTTQLAMALVHVPGGSALYPRLSSVLQKLDNVLLDTVTPLRSWAWYTIIVATA